MTAAALATADTAMAASALACMLRGRWWIRQGAIGRHRAWMLAAFSFSTAFLVLFVSRVVLHGVRSVQVEGPLRVVAIALMAAHDGFAVAVIPLVLVTLSLGLTGRYARHREVARVAWPIWVYVSMTGIATWFLLYVVIPW